MTNPKQYLFQKMHNYESCPSEIGNYADAQRNYDCRTLRTDELIIKINETIQRERANKDMNTQRSLATIKKDWNFLLQTKLFNKPKL